MQSIWTLTSLQFCFMGNATFELREMTGTARDEKLKWTMHDSDQLHLNVLWGTLWGSFQHTSWRSQAFAVPFPFFEKKSILARHPDKIDRSLASTLILPPLNYSHRHPSQTSLYVTLSKWEVHNTVILTLLSHMNTCMSSSRCSPRTDLNSSDD